MHKIQSAPSKIFFTHFVSTKIDLVSTASFCLELFFLLSKFFLIFAKITNAHSKEFAGS